MGRNFAEALGKALRSIDTRGADFHWDGEPLAGDALDAVLATISRPTQGRLVDVQQVLRAGVPLEDVYERTGIDPWFLDQVQLDQRGARPRSRPRRADPRGPAAREAARAVRPADRPAARDAGGGRQPRAPHASGCARSTRPSTPAPPSSPRRRRTTTRRYDEETEVEPRERAAILILGSGPEPHRAGHRVRLLVRARRARAQGRVRDRDDQLQPGDRLDGLRHLRPPLLRAADVRGRPRGLRRRGRRRPGRRGHRAARRADPAVPRAAPGRRRRADPRHHPRGDRRSPRTAARSAGSCATPACPRPRSAPRRRPSEARRDRGVDRLPRARAARRTCSAAAAWRSSTTTPSCGSTWTRPSRRRRTASRRRRCSSTASSTTPSRSTSTPCSTARRCSSAASWSTSRRPASTPATPPACCRRSRCPSASSSASAAPPRRSARASACAGCSTSSTRWSATCCTCWRRTRARPAPCRSSPRRPASRSPRRPRWSWPATPSPTCGRRASCPRPTAPCSTSTRPLAVKEAVLPFKRFRTTDGTVVDTVLGPEMRSTGEVMGFDVDFPTAFAKSQAAAYGGLPTSGTVFISVADRDKRAIVFPIKRLVELGFEILATEGTAGVLRRSGIPSTRGAQVLDRAAARRGSRRSSTSSAPARSTWSSTPRPVRVRARTATRSGPRPPRPTRPIVTTVQQLGAAVQGIEAALAGPFAVTSLQEHDAARAPAASPRGRAAEHGVARRGPGRVPGGEPAEPRRRAVRRAPGAGHGRARPAVRGHRPAPRPARGLGPAGRRPRPAGASRCGSMDAVGGRVAAVKPQSALFERHGSAGRRRPRGGRRRPAAATGTLVVVDAKRGDIGSTMAGYADAYLRDGSPLAGDALTVSPYLGFGSLAPAVEAGRGDRSGPVRARPHVQPGGRVGPARRRPGRAQRGARRRRGGGRAQRRRAGVGGLRRTGCGGGPGAPGRAALGSVGLVVGATIGDAARRLGVDLAAVRGPLLAPGVGAQGAGPAELAHVFGAARGAVLASSSRGVLAAGPDVGALRAAAERAAADAASALRDPRGPLGTARPSGRHRP